MAQAVMLAARAEEAAAMVGKGTAAATAGAETVAATAVAVMWVASAAGVTAAAAKMLGGRRQSQSGLWSPAL